MDTFKYCITFWRLNDHKLKEQWERDMYMGKTLDNPHGIESEEWRLAYEQYKLTGEGLNHE